MGIEIAICISILFVVVFLATVDMAFSQLSDLGLRRLATDAEAGSRQKTYEFLREIVLTHLPYFDYAETCHTHGTLKFKPRLNPKGRKHTLAWEEADTEPIQLPTRRHRKTKHADTLLSRSLKGQTAAYRLGIERHEKLKTIAEAYNLRLADVLSAFFRHSLDAYQAGKLKIRREPVVMQMQVKGWSG